MHIHVLTRVPVCMHVRWLMCMCLSMWRLKVDVGDSLHHSSTLLTEAGTQSNSELTNMLSVAVQLALGTHLLSLELQRAAAHTWHLCVFLGIQTLVVSIVRQIFSG